MDFPKKCTDRLFHRQSKFEQVTLNQAAGSFLWFGSMLDLIEPRRWRGLALSALRGDGQFQSRRAVLSHAQAAAESGQRSCLCIGRARTWWEAPKWRVRYGRF